MRQSLLLIFLWLSATDTLSAQPAAFPQLTLKAPEKKDVATSEKFSSFLIVKNDSAYKPLPTGLPLNFYSQHLGAACKMELQLEKGTKLPIRIRLGSKEQVDYLEGKFSRNQ